MPTVYKYFNSNANGITFADLSNPQHILRFSGNTVNVPGMVNGRRVQAVRNTITVNLPTLVLPEGCADSCNALSATLSASVTLSAPAGAKDALIAQWTQLKEAVDSAIADHNILSGFKPAGTASFTLGA